MNRLLKTNKKWPEILCLILLSLVSAVALTADFDDLPGKFNIVTVLLIPVLLLFYTYSAGKFTNNIWVGLIGLLSAFFLLIGKSYSALDSSEMVFGSGRRTVFFFISLIGYGILLYFIFLAAFNGLALLEKKGKIPAGIEKFLFGKLSVLKLAGIILIFWLPAIIMCYPGAVCGDSVYQIYQTLGRYSLDTIHPLTHTLFVGGFLKLGNLLGSYNRGLYLQILTQSLIMAVVMAYSVNRLYKKGANKVWSLIVLSLFCITPLYSNFATMTVKDSLFNTFILLFFTLLTGFVYEDKYKMTIKSGIALVLSGLGVMLFRNNGPIVFVCTVLGLTVCIFLQKETKIKDKLINTAVLAILPFVLFVLINALFVNALGAKKIDGKEVLSIPFQQTGRYVRDYGNEVTADEWDAIGKVLHTDGNIAASYDPNISDPLKRLFVGEATTGDIAGYLVVWAKMFFKHPGVYLEAFFNQIYGWFDLGVRNSVRYQGSMDIFYPPRWGDYTGILNKWFEFLGSNPVTGILECIALYVWWMFLLIIKLVKKKEKKGLLIFMFPLFMSLLVCVASPCCLLHPRYAFPIVFTIPYLSGYILKEENK